MLGRPNIFRQTPLTQIFTNAIDCMCFFFFVSATQSAILLEACKVLMCKICKVNMAFKCYTLLFQRILLVLNFFFLTFVGKCYPRSLEGYHLLVDLCQ